MKRLSCKYIRTIYAQKTLKYLWFNCNFQIYSSGLSYSCTKSSIYHLAWFHFPLLYWKIERILTYFLQLWFYSKNFFSICTNGKTSIDLPSPILTSFPWLGMAFIMKMDRRTVNQCFKFKLYLSDFHWICQFVIVT